MSSPVTTLALPSTKPILQAICLQQRLRYRFCGYRISWCAQRSPLMGEEVILLHLTAISNALVIFTPTAKSITYSFDVV